MNSVVSDLVWIKSKVICGKPDNWTFENVLSTFFVTCIIPDKTLVININLQRINSSDQDIHSEIELASSDNKHDVFGGEYSLISRTNLIRYGFVMYFCIRTLSSVSGISSGLLITNIPEPLFLP